MSYRDIAEKIRRLRESHPSGEVGTVIEAVANQEERLARIENELNKVRSEMQQLKSQALKRY